MFNDLVETCMELLPGYGKHLAIDGKAIESFAVKPGKIAGDERGDHDSTKVVPGHSNVVYNYQGTVFCHCPTQKDKVREMAFGGFEKDRATLKYRCPAKHYGYECKGMKDCPVKSAVRIPLD